MMILITITFGKFFTQCFSNLKRNKTKFIILEQRYYKTLKDQMKLSLKKWKKSLIMSLRNYIGMTKKFLR